MIQTHKEYGAEPPRYGTDKEHGAEHKTWSKQYTQNEKDNFNESRIWRNILMTQKIHVT